MKYERHAGSFFALYPLHFIWCRGTLPKPGRKTRKFKPTKKSAALAKKFKLSKGWHVDSVKRKSGESKGNTDYYYYTPGGKRLRSWPEVLHELGRA